VPTAVQSVAEVFRRLEIRIGELATDFRILQRGDVGAVIGARLSGAPLQSNKL
jgi:hypothetical protein